MQPKRTKTCKTCLYMDGEVTEGEGPVDCRARSPRMGERKWPQVFGCQFCGEWVERDLPGNFFVQPKNGWE